MNLRCGRSLEELCGVLFHDTLLRITYLRTDVALN